MSTSEPIGATWHKDIVAYLNSQATAEATQFSLGAVTSSTSITAETNLQHHIPDPQTTAPLREHMVTDPHSHAAVQTHFDISNSNGEQSILPLEVSGAELFRRKLVFAGPNRKLHRAIDVLCEYYLGRFDEADVRKFMSEVKAMIRTLNLPWFEKELMMRIEAELAQLREEEPTSTRPSGRGGEQMPGWWGIAAKKKPMVGANGREPAKLERTTRVADYGGYIAYT